MDINILKIIQTKETNDQSSLCYDLIWCLNLFSLEYWCLFKKLADAEVVCCVTLTFLTIGWPSEPITTVYLYSLLYSFV